MDTDSITLIYLSKRKPTVSDFEELFESPCVLKLLRCNYTFASFRMCESMNMEITSRLYLHPPTALAYQTL